MRDRIFFKINQETDWSIKIYLSDLEFDTLVGLYEDHRSVLINNIPGMFKDKRYKSMMINMELFEDRIKNSVVLYILLCDTIGYTIQLNTLLYYKGVDGRWVGYDVVDGLLTRYEDNDKDKLIDKLRSW